MRFRQLLNPLSGTFTYTVSDDSNRYMILVDPTLEQVDRDAALLTDAGFEPAFIALTYTDDDRMAAASRLSKQTSINVVSRLGRGGGAHATVQGGDRLAFGTSVVEVLDTPGYRPDNVSYLVGHRVFTGGALSVRHCGNGYQNLLDPGRLYDSVINVLFQLPDETLVYPSHHRGGSMVTTIGEERRYNPELIGRDRDAFVQRYSRPPDQLLGARRAALSASDMG